MIATILLLGAAFAALLAIFPYVFYPLTLAWLAKRYGKPLQTAVAPAQLKYASLTCAYNEQKSLGDKIANLRALKEKTADLEILVYSDGSSDETPRMLQQNAPMIRTEIAEQRHGKSFGMNRMVSATQADILVFSDANVILDTNAIRVLETYFADPEVGCVCGHLIYTNAGDSATAYTGALYWRLEEKIKQLESATGSTMGADGSLFAVRRALYPRVPADIIDDMYVSLSILCAGYRVVSAPDFIAYEKTAVKTADEFRRKIRIACQAFNCHRLLWPRLRRLPGLEVYKYLVHKLLRWFGLYFFALAAGQLLLAVALLFGPTAAVALALAGLGVAAAGLFGRIKLVCRLYEIAAAITATGVGILASLSGRRFQTWTVAASSR